jgi:hypothetical protein
MSDDTVDESIRLEQAFREISAQRAQATEAHAPDPIVERSRATNGHDADRDGDPGTEEPVAEERVVVDQSDLAVEMGVLTAAVHHLQQRVDALAERLDQVTQADASTGRGPLRSGLRSMTTGRSGRNR